MSHRLAKINKNIQRIIGEILKREADVPNDVIITVSRVETRPNLQSANVWLYITPLTKSQEIIKQLHSDMYRIQGIFNRELNTRPLPRLTFRVDEGAEKAAGVDQYLREL